MRNKIIILSLIISLIFIISLASFGFKIGGFEILSINELAIKNNKIKDKIKDVTFLTSTTYPSKVRKLEETIDEFTIQKQKYEEISEFSDEEENVYETEKYDIGYLWTKLGKLANKNKINLALDIKKSVGTGMYDLDFTIYGEYVNISSFVTKLENDSDLLFRIYNFKLVPGNSTINLKATFTVRDVNVDEKTLKHATITNLE